MYWSWWCLHVCTITAATCTSLRCIWFIANENVKIHLNQLSQNLPTFTNGKLYFREIFYCALAVFLFSFFFRKIRLILQLFQLSFFAHNWLTVYISYGFLRIICKLSLVLDSFLLIGFFPATHRTYGKDSIFIFAYEQLWFFLGYLIAKQQIDKKTYLKSSTTIKVTSSLNTSN